MKKKFYLISLLMAVVILTSCNPSTVSSTEVWDTTSSTKQVASNTTSSEKEIGNSDTYCIVNNNVPFFYENEYTTDAFEIYSPLDELGRCGVAYANICTEIMPTEERGQIGSLKPTGWHTVKYNGIVDGNYLYNRCHLIGFQLAGENANERNLITGTRYLNNSGMLPFENRVSDYVKETNNHVLYRVTPKFYKNNLLADGVLIEAHSVEDDGKLEFCVFCYNVQPGITIDYSTGESKVFDGTPIETSENYEASPSVTTDVKVAETQISETENQTQPIETQETQSIEAYTTDEEAMEYVLNTNTKKYHLPTCASASEMKDENRQSFYGTSEELISKGYQPCKRCNP